MAGAGGPAGERLQKFMGVGEGGIKLSPGCIPIEHFKRPLISKAHCSLSSIRIRRKCLSIFEGHSFSRVSGRRQTISPLKSAALIHMHSLELCYLMAVENENVLRDVRGVHYARAQVSLPFLFPPTSFFSPQCLHGITNHKSDGSHVRDEPKQAGISGPIERVSRTQKPRG